MSTLSKIALGMMGRLRPEPPRGDAVQVLTLPAAERRGGLPLMEAIAARRSSREFAPDALPVRLLSNLLWAAWGVNRADGGHWIGGIQRGGRPRH